MGQEKSGLPRPAVTWVFLKEDSGLYEVGFFDSNGTWRSESAHKEKEDAAGRCHYLNGMDKDTISRADCETCRYRLATECS